MPYLNVVVIDPPAMARNAVRVRNKPIAPTSGAVPLQGCHVIQPKTTTYLVSTDFYILSGES